MTATRAFVTAAFSVALAVGSAAAGQDARVTSGSAARPSNGVVRLAADVPAAIQRGRPVTIVLHVNKDGRPVDDAGACLAPVPLFISVEDAMDSTPAGGVDLGSTAGTSVQPACTQSIAGVPTAHGAYAFAWEPDTAGRVNLTFTAAGGAIRIPVDVASAPASRAVLASFALLVVLILGTAAWLRRRARLERAPS